jgi:hypothetical protein
MNNCALGVIDRYRAYLPVTGKTPVITLIEGNTPLVEAPRLAAEFGAPHVSLYLKLEGLNPTVLMQHLTQQKVLPCPKGQGSYSRKSLIISCHQQQFPFLVENQ